MTIPRQSTLIVGAGKVGKSLLCALQEVHVDVSSESWRERLQTPVWADLVVLAVRDGEIEAAAEALAKRLPSTKTAPCVLHCAGSVGLQVLAALRVSSHGKSCAVGRFHPLVSVATTSSVLRGAFAVISGDPAACRRAEKLAQQLGMQATCLELEAHSYHAGAALLANGSVALATAAKRLLVNAGCPPEQAAPMLGRLLESVGRNIAQLDVPAALSGPVRRGAVNTLKVHRERLRKCAPDLVPLYEEVVRVQLQMAIELAEAPPESFDLIKKMLGDAG